jgi:hypothetical protein
MNVSLRNLQDELRAIGRGVVLIAEGGWKPGEKIVLRHLGDTEGDISVAANESYVHMTLPELTGPAKHASFVEGEDPVITLPLFIADPEIRAVISPTGSASGGHSRRRPVKTHTLVIIPEELFFDAEADTYGALSFDAGVWKVNNKALTADQQRLLDLSFWAWRGFFNRSAIPYRHSDAGKTVESVSFQLMVAPAMPDGHQLYTVGDPADADIDIDAA